MGIYMNNSYGRQNYDLYIGWHYFQIINTITTTTLLPFQFLNIAYDHCFVFFCGSAGVLTWVNCKTNMTLSSWPLLSLHILLYQFHYNNQGRMV